MSSDSRVGEENRDTVELSSDIQNEAVFTGKWMQQPGRGTRKCSFLFAVSKIYRGGREWNYERQKIGRMGDVLSYSVLGFVSVEWLGS